MWFHILVQAGKPSGKSTVVLTAWYLPSPLWAGFPGNTMVTCPAGWPSPPVSINSPAQPESPLVTCQKRRGSLLAYIGIFFLLPQCMRSWSAQIVFPLWVGPRFLPQCMDHFFLSKCQQDSFCNHPQRQGSFDIFLIRIHPCVAESPYFIDLLVLTQ